MREGAHAALRLGLEGAKTALRTALYRFNIDLGRDPYQVRVARTLSWIGAEAVLDIGANVGQYGALLRASGYRGRLVSCEPLPDAFTRLSRRASRDPRWDVDQSAVGAMMSNGVINVSANSFSSSILPMTAAHLESAPGSEFVGTHLVAVTTVQDLVARHRLNPRRTLLKVDTQGYEAPVLDGAGALLGDFAAVQVELSLVELYEGADLADVLTRRLTGLGFALYAVAPGYPDRRTGRMMQYDGLFVRGDLLPTYGSPSV